MLSEAAITSATFAKINGGKLSRKKRFFLICAYVGFLVFLLEGSMRLALMIPKVSKRLRTDEDYSYRRNWVQRHQKSGIGFRYTFDIYDPSKGWRSRPNLRDMKVFGDKRLNTNSRGFRGKKNFAYAKDKDKLRILILGDSFTFGDGVSDHETYAYHLQEMLPHAEIINLGVHGYGHDQMLILLKEEGIKYRPDIVLLGFVRVDMSRNLLTFRDFAKPRFVLKAGELRLTGVPVPRPEDILRRDWIRPRMVDLFAIVNERVRTLLGLRDKEMEVVTTAILTDMIGVITSIHAVPIIAYMPVGSEIAEPDAVTQYERYLFAMCQANGRAKCFSTRPSFAKKIAQGETFKMLGHWAAAGHRTVAEALAQYMVAEGYVTGR